MKNEKMSKVLATLSIFDKVEMVEMLEKKQTTKKRLANELKVSETTFCYLYSYIWTEVALHRSSQLVQSLKQEIEHLQEKINLQEKIITKLLK